MTRRRLRTAVAAGVAVAATAVAGCGDSRTGKPPSVAALPLVGGARVVAAVSQCDPGANAFCATQVVIEDPRYRTSRELFDAERRWLRSAHWTRTYSDTDLERAAESPHGRLRVTLATADGDLRAIDLGWVHRTRTIALALSRAIFTHASAISVMLEAGSS